MSNTITISVRLFQEELKQIYVTFLVNIHGKKQGYMSIPLGNISQENALWEGIYKVLSLLKEKYSQYRINFGFSSVLFEVNGVFKDKCLSQLNEFEGYEFVESVQVDQELEDFHKIAKTSKTKNGQIFGLNKDELITYHDGDSKQKKPKPSKPKLEFYTGLSRPKSGVCIDFETTSQITDYARIIEISAIKFNVEGQIVDEFNTLVNCEMNIPKKIRELTGINNEDIKTAPNPFDAMRKLYAFMKGSPVILGHHVEYDYSILETFCTRFNIPYWKAPLLCTRRLAKEMLVQVEDYRLETLCRSFGITNQQAHRAWSDTKATIEVMNYLYGTSLFSDEWGLG